jgi:hypothetical protein
MSPRAADPPGDDHGSHEGAPLSDGATESLLVVLDRRGSAPGPHAVA